MNKGNLIIMCGVPGSGKTHFAKKLMNFFKDQGESDDWVYLSSDDIRVELFGFEDQTKHKETFKEMNMRCIINLREGKNVIYDATSLTRKLRTNLINEMREFTNRVTIYAYVVDYKLLREINETRVERKLSEKKLTQLYLSYELPDFKSEDFDRCIVRTTVKRPDGTLFSYVVAEMWGDDVAKIYEI